MRKLEKLGAEQDACQDPDNVFHSEEYSLASNIESLKYETMLEEQRKKAQANSSSSKPSASKIRREKRKNKKRNEQRSGTNN